MDKRALRSDALLLLTACIWGFGFVAQRSGMEYIGPFAFNGVCFLPGSLSLLPLILYRNRRARKTAVRGPARTAPAEAPSGAGGRSSLYPLAAPLAAGTCLFVAVSLQQLGMLFTTAGNAGFITGLYVVLTPILGICWGRKTGFPTWIGAFFTLGGLFFLSAAGHLDRINPGDAVIALSALFWAVHVLLIDRLVRRLDPIVLSAGQFAWCGLFSLIAAFTLEPFTAARLGSLAPDLGAGGLFSWRPFPDLLQGLSSGALPWALISGALIPILYRGFGSVGVAYTLQVVAQKDAPPAHATIILSLEGCFAALGGVLLLKEPLGPWTLLGFALILGGMLITQWEVIAGGGKKAV